MKNESGKGMLENLSALAIAGTLGFGGISGFNTAIANYKAGIILNEVALRQQTIYDQMASDSAELNLFEFKDKISNNYSVELETNLTEKNFSISVDNLPKRICKKLITNHPKKTDHIVINNHNTNDLCQKDENKIAFVFKMSDSYLYASKDFNY